MAEFVYNRTQNHVDRLKQLRAKGFENLTESEQLDYFDYARLGAYNSTDLNRVEAAVAEIADVFSMTLNTRTWGMWVSPTSADMDRYLGNVVALRDMALSLDHTLAFPTLPISMEYLTFEGANTIEETLSIIYERFQVGIPGSGTADDPYVYANLDEFTKAWNGRIVPGGETVYVKAPLCGTSLDIKSVPEGACGILNDKNAFIGYSGDCCVFEGSDDSILLGVRNINVSADEVVTLSVRRDTTDSSTLGTMVLGNAILGRGGQTT